MQELYLKRIASIVESCGEYDDEGYSMKTLVYNLILLIALFVSAWVRKYIDE